MPAPAPPIKFTPYQIAVVAILAFLQFTVVLDFMILSPLGAMLMEKLDVSPAQFGLVVSAYAFSAGISGLLTAGFADRFDRKRLLLFFYTGFVVGTALCGLAPTYAFLLVARTITGLFGGVIGSISMAIITDLFPLAARGRVMGFVMTAFSASQVLGIPLGLYLSTGWGWHAPFLMIASVGLVVGVVIAMTLRPIDAHLKTRVDRHPLQHVLGTLAKPRHQWGFVTTITLATGGFMLMPFGSAFSVHNLGIPLEKLPVVYVATGLASMISGPIIGRISDAVGKYRTFTVASLVAVTLVLVYTRLGLTPIGLVIAINIVLFMAISGRMIGAQALSSAIPAPPDRGAYMSIAASLQQLAGGVAASCAGLLVSQSGNGPMEHYERLGYVVATTMLITILLMGKVDALVKSDAPAKVPGVDPGGKPVAVAAPARAPD